MVVMIILFWVWTYIIFRLGKEFGVSEWRRNHVS